MVMRTTRLYSVVSMRQIILVLTCTCLTTIASAQSDDVQRTHVIVGAGQVVPVGSTAPCSIKPILPTGVGFAVASEPPINQAAELKGFGRVQSAEHKYSIPLSGLHIIPNPFKRKVLSPGVAGASVDHSETTAAGRYGCGCSIYSSQCGWSGYGLSTASYVFGTGHDFHVGTTFEFAAASTNGLANVPGQTTGHWSNFYFELGFRF